MNKFRRLIAVGFWPTVALPIAVTLFYGGCVIWTQPQDRLGTYPGAWLPWTGATDDYDDAAMALRGLNAHFGRTAGRRDEPLYIAPDEQFSEMMAAGGPPQPRYYLEYPHGVLPLFRLPFVLDPPPELPAALLDGNQGNLVTHDPEEGWESAFWKQLRRATRVYRLVMMGCLAALTVVVWVGYLPGRRLAGGGLLLALPAAVFFGVNRFDVVPALLTALSLACLGRRRPAIAAVLLAAATVVKVYPVLLAPLVVRHLYSSSGWKSALVWAVAYGAGLAAFVGPTVVQEGWETAKAPYEVQLARGGVTWGTLYEANILPVAMAENDFFGRASRQGALVLVALLLAWRPMPHLEDLLRRGAVLLLVFLSLSVFYSPQWVLWLTPLLAPAAARDWRVAILAVAFDLMNYGMWPLAGGLKESGVLQFASKIAEDDFISRLVMLRCAIYAALALALLVPIRPYNQED